MCAGGQLRGQAPEPLAANQDHREGPLLHGGVQGQLQPGRACLCCRSKVGWPCEVMTGLVLLDVLDDEVFGES